MKSLFSRFRIGDIQLILLLTICCSPLYTMDFGALNLYFVLAILIVISFVWMRVKYGSIKYNQPYNNLLWTLVVMSIVFDLVLGKDVIQANKVLVLTLLVAMFPVNETTSELIYVLLAIVGVVFGIYMLRNPAMVADVRLSTQVGDWVMDPNWAAMIFIPTFCFGLQMLKEKFINYIIGIVLISFAFVLCFLSGSRGAIVALICGFMLWAYLNKVIKGKSIIVLVILFFLAYFFIQRMIPSFDMGLIDRYNGTVDDTGRKSAWLKILNGFSKGNLFEITFGHGSGSTVSEVGIAAHNIFLEQLYTKGVVGVVLLLLFMIKFLKTTVRLGNYTGAYIVVSLYVVSLFTPVWGGVYMMMPLAAVAYMNNYMLIKDKNETL